MVGTKVTITSKRPQTTRNTIRGVAHGDGYQIVLVDTPGLHKPRTELGNRLNAMVYGTLAEVDAVIFVVDATMPVGPGDRLVADRLIDSASYVVVAVNKVDAASRAATISQLVEASQWPFEHYFPVSAKTGEGVAELVEHVVSQLPEGPQYYPDDMITDQPEAIVIAEIIREKFLDRLREELPHALIVRVEDITVRDDGLIDISADLIVERSSQKGIVIGKGGSLLEVAGSEARTELEALLGDRINLRLHVTVEKDWQRTPQLLDRLGFEDH